MLQELLIPFDFRNSIRLELFIKKTTLSGSIIITGSGTTPLRIETDAFIITNLVQFDLELFQPRSSKGSLN